MVFSFSHFTALQTLDAHKNDNSTAFLTFFFQFNGSQYMPQGQMMQGPPMAQGQMPPMGQGQMGPQVYTSASSQNYNNNG